MIALPEGVRLGVFTRENLLQMWEHLKPYDSLFMDCDMKNPEVFLANFLARDSVTLETEGGYMIMRHIIPGLKGEVHMTFWDKHLSPRVGLIKNCLTWAFLSFDLYRIETLVAEYAKSVRRFIEQKLNFKHEGCLRNSAWHLGRLIDMHVYAILREEV
jgi:RimJ/RimL family protein N-acetyltransferase